ncbi:MAG: HAD-IIIA family hydrolase [Puniceicoccales bacterium]|jgi:D-glycero-D-manno-heptose 1,7-bisphosphate phosphatase|nr:HAD-IIIA family hydrolase [Puniceicoccales bacterium]
MNLRRIAVFLDRDGTIIEDKNYLKNPEDVVLLGGAREAIEILKNMGCLLFLFSNQSGVGRGFFTADDVQMCNCRMVELLGCGEKIFDEICLAFESPWEISVYRKPSPKFIIEMMEKYKLLPENCYMVGDKESDVLAARNAAITPILISNCSDSDFKGINIFSSIFSFSNWLIRSE